VVINTGVRGRVKGACAGLKKNPPARWENLGDAGVLFGIDQEVVTLRGLYGNSGVLTDLRQAESILIHR
jgi:hypothetical protein